MATAVRSTNSIGFAGRTNTTIPAPSGITNGDILLAILEVGQVTASPSVTPPSGFTEVTANSYPITYSGSGFEIKAHVYWKLASSESGNYTFTHAAAYATEAVMYCISGADQSSPINPAPTKYETASGSNPLGPAPGLTAPRDGSLVIFFAATWLYVGPTTPPTGTTPTFVEYYDSSDGTLYSAAGVLATSGATGDKSLATTGSVDSPGSAGLICVQAAAAQSVVPVLMYQYRERRV